MDDKRPPEVIEGGGDPEAHLHRRMLPECDWCGAPLKGRMPKPFWVAYTARQTDEHGHEVPEDGHVRVYLCKEHREAMDQAARHAYEREVARSMAGQPFLTAMAKVKPVKPV